VIQTKIILLTGKNLHLYLNKGEKWLDSHYEPMKNNLFGVAEPDEEAQVILDKKKKAKIQHQDTSQIYSGDAKSELVKIIHEGGFISIEHFFTSAFKWKLTDFVSFEEFLNKGEQYYPNIPEEDLQTLFDDLDINGKGKIKVKNIVRELKSQVENEEKDTISLLVVEDIQPRYKKMSPRSSSSFLIQEIKEHCERQNYRLEEIFRISKEGTKNYATKNKLRDEIRRSLPQLSRSLIEDILNDFSEDKIKYTEFLIYFDLKDTKIKTADSSAKSQKKWITKYTEVL